MIARSTRATTGSLFTRTASAIAAGGGFNTDAVRFANRWSDTPDVSAWLERSLVAGSSTDDADGLALPGTAEFLNLVRPRTLLGRIGRLRRVPFHSGAAIASGGVQFGWLGEGAPTPVGSLSWSRAALPVAKAGGIVVLTKELLGNPSPNAESLTREELVSGLAQFLDQAFVDPLIAEVSGVSPASITNGVTPIASSGTTEADARADIRALVQATFDDLNTLDGVVLMMSDAIAFKLAMMTNAAGGAAFPGIGVDGGSLFGIPTLTSSAVGDQIIALHAPSLLYADEGQTEVDSASHATIVMDSDPAAVGTPANMVSMWQANSAAIRVVRYLNWEKARAGAVHVVAGVDYV